MKNNWIVVQVEKDEKYFAYMIRVSKSDNLISKLNIKHIVTANIFNTKKEALKLIENWNEGHKRNNRYMFDDLLF